MEAVLSALGTTSLDHARTLPNFRQKVQDQIAALLSPDGFEEPDDLRREVENDLEIAKFGRRKSMDERAKLWQEVSLLCSILPPQEDGGGPSADDRRQANELLQKSGYLSVETWVEGLGKKKLARAAMKPARAQATKKDFEADIGSLAKYHELLELQIPSFLNSVSDDRKQDLSSSFSSESFAEQPVVRVFLPVEPKIPPRTPSPEPSRQNEAMLEEDKHEHNMTSLSKKVKLNLEDLKLPNHIDPELLFGNFHLESIIWLIKEHRKKVQFNSSLVAVVGRTGAGKSTTMNWIMGQKIVKRAIERTNKYKGFDQLLVCEDKSLDGLQIGTDQYQSQTFYIKGYTEKRTGLCFIDSPGLGETKGVNIAISNSVAITSALHQSTSVRIVVLVSYESLTTERGNLMRTLLDEMLQLISFQDNGILDSVLILYSHAKFDTCSEEICSRLEELKENVNPRMSLFLDRAIKLLEEYKETLIIRPDKDTPDALIKIIEDIKPIENPQSVFHCPLGLSLEGRLTTACQDILDNVNAALEIRKFSDVVRHLDSLELLSSTSLITTVTEKYHSAVDAALKFYTKELNFAEREFEHKDFNSCYNHMKAFEDNRVLMHISRYQKLREVEVSLADQVSSFEQKMNTSVAAWLITAPTTVQECDFTEYQQRLSWLRGACTALSSHLTQEIANAYKVSCVNVLRLITQLDQFTIELQARQWVVQGTSDLRLCLDQLRSVNTNGLEEHLQSGVSTFYYARLGEIHTMANDHFNSFNQRVEELRNDEEVNIKHCLLQFSPLINFFEVVRLELNGHLSELVEKAQSVILTLETIANDNETAIAKHPRQYRAIVVFLRKFELVSRLLDTAVPERGHLARFMARVLEERVKVEALATQIKQHLSEEQSFSSSMFLEMNADLKVLQEACSLLQNYLEVAQSIKQAGAAEVDLDGIRKEIDIKLKTELTEGIKATLSLLEPGCAVSPEKDLVIILSKLDNLYLVRDHVTGLESAYSTLRIKLEQRVESLTSFSALLCEDLNFVPTAVNRQIVEAQAFAQAFKAMKGDFFGARCVTLAVELETAANNAKENVLQRLKVICDFCIQALDAENYTEAKRSFALIEAMEELFDRKLEREAKDSLLKYLDAKITVIEKDFRDHFGNDRLYDADTARNTIGAMMVLDNLSPRIAAANSAMELQLKGRKSDFSVRCANMLEMDNYDQLATVLLGGKSFSTAAASVEEQKQWRNATKKIEQYFRVPADKALAFFNSFGIRRRDVVSATGYNSHKPIFEKLTRFSEEAKSVLHIFPEVVKLLPALQTAKAAAIKSIYDQASMELAVWNFLEADRYQTDLITLESEQSNVLEKDMRNKIDELDEDIGGFIRYGFRPKKKPQIETKQVHRPREGKEGPPNSPPPQPAEEKRVEQCTDRECKCKECEFEAFVSPFQIDRLYDRLYAARDLNLIARTSVYFDRLNLLDRHVEGLFDMATYFIKKRKVEYAEPLVNAFQHLKKSQCVVTKTKFDLKRAESLQNLFTKIFSVKPLTYRDLYTKPIADSKKLLEELIDADQYDTVFEELKNAMRLKSTGTTQSLKTLDSKTDWQNIVIMLRDLSNLHKAVEALTDCQLPECVELAEDRLLLENKLEQWIALAEKFMFGLRWNEKMEEMDQLKTFLSRFLQELGKTTAPELLAICKKFEARVLALNTFIDENKQKATAGWNYVVKLDLTIHDPVLLKNLIDYLVVLKPQAHFVESIGVSHPEAIKLIKSKLEALKADGLWKALENSCRLQQTQPPILAAVICNLNTLARGVPEVGADVVKQSLLKQIEQFRSSIAKTVTQAYQAHVTAVYVDKDAEQKLNKEREVLAAVDLKLKEFMSLEGSADDMIAVTLKGSADAIFSKFKKSNSASVDEIADALVEIYSIGAKVSIVAVKLHVKSLLKSVLSIARQRDDKLNMNNIAIALENPAFADGVGADIVRECDEFQAYRNKLFKQKTSGMTFDVAIEALKKLNPSVTSAQEGLLKGAFADYTTQYQQYTGKHLKPDTLFAEVKRGIEKLKKKEYGAPTIARAIAGISACMALDFLNDGLVDKAVDLEAMNPHPVQILALFRLLGVDQAKSWFLEKIGWGTSNDSHLIQIGTGEGKSIVLGILSIFLGLLGFDVDCVCYSDVLSKRDYNAFKRLFEGFGLVVYNPQTQTYTKQSVRYDTFRDLARRVFDEGGKVRDGTLHLLNRTLQRGQITSRTAHERILLIDEVDTFFSRDFYGAIYTPAALLKGPEIMAVLNFIWANKGKDLGFVKQSAPYQALIRKYCSQGDAYAQAIQRIFDGQIGKMVTAATDYQTTDHRIVDGKIGIVEHGTIKYDLTDGYRTTWWYFQELEKRSISQQVFDEKVGMSVTCGAFSYAEVVYKYDRVLGVTGTLEQLGTYERKIVADYKILGQTIMPSLYGIRDASFDQGIHIEATKEAFFRKIGADAAVMASASRATLIFFENEKILQEFVVCANCPPGLQFIVSGENLDHYVRTATKNKRITAFHRVFGRGLDFVCVDSMVRGKGGVHVIQTFLSEDVNEEIQIKGRTCRQGDPGSYKMILLRDDLLQWNQSKGNKGKPLKLPPLITAEQLDDHKGDLSTFLCGARDKWFAERSKKRIKAVQRALDGNAASLKFQQDLVRADPTSMLNALQFLETADKCDSDLHIIFCLDESGSMAGAPWKQVIEAVASFLDELKSVPSSIVSIIQFASTARVILDRSALDVAARQVLPFAGGGTSFGPPLLQASQLFQKAGGRYAPFLVFMTDGANADGLVSQELQLFKAFPNFQSHFVFFGSAAGQQRMQDMASQLSGQFHLASDLRVTFKAIGKLATRGLAQY